ncbi:MAG: hypothetical protein HY842_20330 [Bacteroidetes bacterium]|nr:hypothetical protein [Bacteroidota bacterium]
MSTNKILLGALAGGVASFFLGWLIYGILLADFANAYPELKPETVTDLTRTPMVWWAMVVSCLVYGLLLAIIFGRWAGISTFAAGAKAGGILALLVALSYDLGMYSMMKTINLNGVLVDPLVNLVMGAIIGGVVGWVLGYGNKSS